jgi:hypothetical protein
LQLGGIVSDRIRQSDDRQSEKSGSRFRLRRLAAARRTERTTTGPVTSCSPRRRRRKRCRPAGAMIWIAGVMFVA